MSNHYTLYSSSLCILEGNPIEHSEILTLEGYKPNQDSTHYEIMDSSTLSTTPKYLKSHGSKLWWKAIVMATNRDERPLSRLQTMTKGHCHCYKPRQLEQWQTKLCRLETVTTTNCRSSVRDVVQGNGSNCHGFKPTQGKHLSRLETHTSFDPCHSSKPTQYETYPHIVMVSNRYKLSLVHS